MLNEIVLKKFVEKQLVGIPLIGLSQINRLQSLSEKISSELEFDAMVLNTSIMLHNIGVRQWMDFNNNVVLGSVAISKRFLSDNFFPHKKISGVVHCIEQCHLKGIPLSIEAKILHDAFLLDEMGAIGVLKDSFVFVKQKKPFSSWISSAKQKLSLVKNGFSLENA